MSKVLRTIKRRHQVARRKQHRKDAFAAYREAEAKAGREPMPRSLWREKWAEEWK